MPGTRVVMADGSTKPIEEVETGDEVLATDPETGEQSARTVLATIIGSGSKVLVEVTIDPTTERDAPEGETVSAGVVEVEDAGIPGPVVAGDVVIATDGHSFWVPDLKEWVEAIDLAPGMWLQTSAGTWVQINAIRAWSQPATVHNLTVQGVHTYHVAAGSLDALNHNCNESVSFDPDSISATGREIYQKNKGATGSTWAGRAYQKKSVRSTNVGQWPSPTKADQGPGDPGGWNKLGNAKMDDILFHPDAVAIRGRGNIRGSYADLVDIRVPGMHTPRGLGVRASVDGVFETFLD